jgi:hypothetical protein
MNHKPLKKEFYRKTFTYKLLKREENKAIYEQCRDGKLMAYEVIIIRRHNGYTLAESYIEPAETYPSDSEWGVFGWTFQKNDLQAAEKKYNLLP